MLFVSVWFCLINLNLPELRELSNLQLNKKLSRTAPKTCQNCVLITFQSFPSEVLLLNFQNLHLSCFQTNSEKVLSFYSRIIDRARRTGIIPSTINSAFSTLLGLPNSWLKIQNMISSNLYLYIVISRVGRRTESLLFIDHQ